MRAFLNFTIAILLVITFVGSAFFFVSISKGLRYEKIEPATVETPEEND